MGSKKQYYAVRVGRRTGIFHSWPECEAEVKGYPGARYKGFRSQSEAEAFLRSVDPPRQAGAPATAFAPSIGVLIAEPGPSGMHAGRKRTRDDDDYASIPVPSSRPRSAEGTARWTAPTQHAPLAAHSGAQPYQSGTGRFQPRIEGPERAIDTRQMYVLVRAIIRRHRASCCLCSVCLARTGHGRASSC